MTLEMTPKKHMDIMDYLLISPDLVSSGFMNFDDSPVLTASLPWPEALRHRRQWRYRKVTDP
jgi:hypothetical protein